MDPLEQIELDLSEDCYYCIGRGTTAGKELYWCSACGGSGKARTYRTDGLWWFSRATTAPPPYLGENAGPVK